MKAKESSSERVIAPEGVHVARIVGVVDLGTQYLEQYDKHQRKIRVSFELPTETHTWKEEEGPRPLMVDKKYTLSLSDRASFRKDMEAWLGRKFKKEELAEGFDVDKLLGTTGQVQIVHNETSNATYANIGSLMAAPKGMKVPKQINDSLFFDLDNFDQEVFDKLPEWLQNLIAESPEYEELFEAVGSSQAASVDALTEDE